MKTVVDWHKLNPNNDYRWQCVAWVGGDYWCFEMDAEPENSTLDLLLWKPVEWHQAQVPSLGPKPYKVAGLLEDPHNWRTAKDWLIALDDREVWLPEYEIYREWRTDTWDQEELRSLIRADPKTAVELLDTLEVL